MVREALHAAGIIPPEVERLAAETLLDDGHPRFVWTDTKTDPATYVQVILESIAERQRWRTNTSRPSKSPETIRQLVMPSHPDRLATLAASPDNCPTVGGGLAVQGRAQRNHAVTRSALDGEGADHHFHPDLSGDAVTPSEPPGVT